MRVEDVELCKIEVVVVLVEELESVLFVHIAASEPNTAVVALNRGLSHEKVTKPKILIQLS